MQKVSHYTLHPKIDILELGYQRYKFNPQAKYHWLQNLCLKVLDWIGCNEMATEKVKTWTRTAQQNDHVLKDLMQQENLLSMLHFNPNQYQIFMGPEEYDDMLSMASQGLHVFSFKAQTSTGYQDDRMKEPEIIWHKLKVTVVSWMKGAIIVPK